MKTNPTTLIVLEVELFGKQRRRIVRMALDTGATFTMIPWDVAEILGYDPARSRDRVKLTTASGTERAPLVTVNKIRAMNFEVEDVAVVCHDLPPESTVDGLLGLSYLKHFNTDLHLKNGRVKLRDP